MESTQPFESEDEGFTVVTKKNLKENPPKIITPMGHLRTIILAKKLR